jgi:KDO2-lipid IV(A) lauroyltransferase
VRYASEYALLLGVREAFRHLSPQRAVALGARLGAFYARVRGPRTADAATNLSLAFPDWTHAERGRVLEATFANLGRHLAELCLLQGPHRESLLAGIEVEGHENYEAARSRSESGGMIALTAHFGSWELCAAVMADRGYPVSVVRHDLANPWVDRMVSGWRQAAGVEEIQMGRAAMGVFRGFSQGRVVCMLLDQNAHSDEGVFAPFFGHLALTRSGPARIAVSRRVAVLPVFLFRVGDTSRHVVRLQPPLELEVCDEDWEGALAINVARMNQAIEDAVRQAPDHWLWSHRRFKTRPEGEPPIYPRRWGRRSRSSRESVDA